jgi:RNA polymerase sigma-70 factor, ECF subfamily
MDESVRGSRFVNPSEVATAAAQTPTAAGRELLLEALFRHARQGDQAAWGALYDQTSSLVYALTLRILGNREDAEEAVMDVYWKAWRNLGTYDAARGSIMAWLVMMARSTAIDRLRSGAARSAREEPLREAVEVPGSGDPESDTSLAQRRERIRAALAELSPDQREAIELAFFSGMSHSELAGRLGQPLGTVKTRIRRGLGRLRDTLGDLA